MKKKVNSITKNKYGMFLEANRIFNHKQKEITK